MKRLDSCHSRQKPAPGRGIPAKPAHPTRCGTFEQFARQPFAGAA
jgi:hypothetical protein